MDIAYQVPGGISPDMDALSALATVMGSGRSSRLYDNLVRQQQVAVQAGAGVVPAKGPTFIYLEGMAGQGKDPAQVEKAIDAEIAKIQTGSIQEWELDKARNAARRSLAGSLGSSLQRAILLSRYTVFYNDPGVLNTRYDRVASLTIADLQRVARQYLVPANRAVIVTVPAKPGATGCTSAQKACRGCAMRSRSALCPLLSALSVALLVVQAPMSGQGAAAPPEAPKFKGKAPVSNDIIKVKLPRAQETQLSNGAYLMVLEDHRVPSVRFEIIMIGAGGYYDPPGMPGLADTTASLMDEGTTTKSSEQIAQALDTMAASVSVSANEGSQIATVTGSALTDQFDAVLALASDILLNPSFPEKEIGLYKVRARAGLEEQRSDPDFLRQERYSKAVYGGHPASSVGLTRESLEKMNRDTLVSFHKSNYVPDHAIIGVSGDITLAEARTKFEAALKGWTKSGTPLPGVTDPPDHGASKISLVNRSASVQTALMLGELAISRTRSRLRRDGRHEPDSRRVERQVVSRVAREKGLYLRRVQQYEIAALPWGLARADGCADRCHRACAARSAGRDQQDPRRAGADRRVQGRPALADRLICPLARGSGSTAEPLHRPAALQVPGRLLGSVHRSHRCGDARPGSGGRP